MPNVNVTLKEGASHEELEKAKKTVTDQGGKIINEFKLIKGFTYVDPRSNLTYIPQIQDSVGLSGHHTEDGFIAELPADNVSILSTNDHITVEEDGVVTTQ